MAMPLDRPQRDSRKRVIQILLPAREGATDYSVRGLQRYLGLVGFSSINLLRNRFVQKLAYLSSKAGLNRNLFQSSRFAMLAQVHGLAEGNLFPASYFFESIVIAFDCWPHRYEQWQAFFRRHRIRVAFITARQSADEFRRRFPEMKIFWLPEACDPGDFRPDKLLVDRKIDVLELGRRFDQFHAMIREPLRASGRSHLFEKARGQIVFPTQEDLVRGYGDTKISVCFPASITDPQFAGDVETVTLRYFESMASKCIVLGHAPAELVDLFGFNPVIEADLNDPAGQIEAILAAPAPYQDLVNRSFTRTLQVATLEGRAKEIAQTLLANGYRL